MKECDLIILFDLPTKVCLESVKSRIGTKREDMPWVETEETFEGEFKQWIQEFSDESLPEIYQLLEKYKDKVTILKMPKKGGIGLNESLSAMCEYAKMLVDKKDTAEFLEKHAY